jgi:hypothetical protein
MKHDQSLKTPHSTKAEFGLIAGGEKERRFPRVVAISFAQKR